MNGGSTTILSNWDAPKDGFANRHRFYCGKLAWLLVGQTITKTMGGFREMKCYNDKTHNYLL